GLPLPERDVEEPLAASRLREPGGSTLAVVEDGRRLVDHEVLEAALRAEVFARHQQVVSSLMPTRSGAPGPRGPRADAPEVQVHEAPRRYRASEPAGQRHRP